MSLPPKKRQFPTRFAALVGGSILLVAALSLINLSPDLSHIDLRLASGPMQGNYFAVGDKLRSAASSDSGTITNVETRGSVDNLSRLVDAQDSCDLQFALVQDGVPAPKNSKLELIARLPRSESVFILGRNATVLNNFESMRGMRVGIGPKGGGTDHLIRHIFETEDFVSLGLRFTNHPVEEQMAMARSGALDLAIFVLDEDAKLIRDAMRAGMQMAAFEHLDILARRFEFLSHGRIGAGQYDPINVVPSEDRRVLRVDTLLLGNGCASRTETIALLSLLQIEFPSILAHNRQRTGSTFFRSSSDAQEYFINGGAEWADTHVPWLVDIMPLGNWFYVIMAISILFNVMTSLHKFRLWRIDAIRDRNQQVFRDLLGAELTPADVYELTISPEHMHPDNITRIDNALQELDKLRARCRKQENSAMVPMGQEIVYRFQEEQIELSLNAMRDFRKRISIAKLLEDDTKTARAGQESEVESQGSADNAT